MSNTVVDVKRDNVFSSRTYPTARGCGQPLPPHRQATQNTIRRKDSSLSVKRLLRDELLVTGRTSFDYGCGHGEDVDLLGPRGVTASGWDLRVYEGCVAPYLGPSLNPAPQMA
jgi:hypothetical protein